MSHDLRWRGSCNNKSIGSCSTFGETVQSTRRDSEGRWLWRLVRRFEEGSADKRSSTRRHVINYKVGDVSKIAIRRKERQSILQGVGGDPVIGIGQMNAGCRQLCPKASINRCRICTRMQDFKRVEILAGFLKRGSRDLGVSLTKEKLAHNV